MECVQFRINQNCVEYRSLIINESEQSRDDGGYETTLRVDHGNEYTDWKPVPKVPIKPVQPPGLTQDEIAELEAEESE